jgi:hypothetical protein
VKRVSAEITADDKNGKKMKGRCGCLHVLAKTSEQFGQLGVSLSSCSSIKFAVCE